jgi:undecaprenyl pyrophosphate phosphatase UppP
MKNVITIEGYVSLYGPYKDWAVGYQCSHENPAMNGKFYIGLTQVLTLFGSVYRFGKVIDGTLYFGYNLIEWSTKDFQYVVPTKVGNETLNLFNRSISQIPSVNEVIRQHPFLG